MIYLCNHPPYTIQAKRRAALTAMACGSMVSIFEKFLFKRVIDYLEKFRLLSTDQYGFLKNSSTIHVIADIHNNLMMTADKVLYNCCLL